MNNQFSIMDDMFDFDCQKGASFSRNVGTLIEGTVFGRVYNFRIPNIIQPNFFFGGPFPIIFNGVITIR